MKFCSKLLLYCICEVLNLMNSTLMKYRSFAILVAFSLSTMHSSAFVTMKSWIGTIQFPFSVNVVPDLRIYDSGTIVKTEINYNNKCISFSLPKNGYQKHFYILIVEADNLYQPAIEHLNIDPKKPYKLYSIECIEQKNGLCKWSIKRQALPSGRVPDTAMIICYDPAYVDQLVGGTNVELPRIIIKEDILNLVGSEDALHSRSHELLLACLGTDAIHQPIALSVKRDTGDPKRIMSFKTLS